MSQNCPNGLAMANNNKNEDSDEGDVCRNVLIKILLEYYS